MTIIKRHLTHTFIIFILQWATCLYFLVMSATKVIAQCHSGEAYVQN